MVRITILIGLSLSVSLTLTNVVDYWICRLQRKKRLLHHLPSPPSLAVASRRRRSNPYKQLFIHTCVHIDANVFVVFLCFDRYLGEMRNGFYSICLLMFDFVGEQKWSKGKQKEKVNNMVLFDQATYDKLLTEAPKYKLITPSILSDRSRVYICRLLFLFIYHAFVCGCR